MTHVRQGRMSGRETPSHEGRGYAAPLRHGSALLLTLLAAALTLALGPAATARAADDGGLLSILVMGDSYSSGTGAGAHYGPDGCYRSSRNYAGVFQKEVEKRHPEQRVFVENVACHGAHTVDVFGGQNIRDEDGPDVPAQIQAVDEGYDIIFLTLGGNDLDFENIAKNCLIPPTRSAKDCGPSLYDAKEMLEGDFRGRNLERRFRSVLTAVKEDADPRAKIVVLGYPYLEGEGDFQMQTPRLFDRETIHVSREIREIGRKGDELQSRVIEELNSNGADSFVFVPTKELFAGNDPDVNNEGRRLEDCTGQDPDTSEGTGGSHELFAERVNPDRWFIDWVFGWDLGISPGTSHHPNPRGWCEEGKLLMRTAAVPKRDRNSGSPTGDPSDPTDPPPPPTPTGPTGTAAGDPHLSSFDQLLYSMQAAGEFQFAASTVDDFAVHVRTRLAGRVSYVDEFAVRTPQGQVAIYDAAGVRLDGVPLNSGEERPLTGGGSVSDRQIQITDGTTVSWSAISSARSVRVQLADGRAGQMRGLLGDGNGTSANDGLTADSRQILGPGALDGLSQEQVDAVLYDDFAASWVAPDGDRLFSGERRPFVKPPPPQAFAEFTPEQIANATAVCEANGWVEPELSLCVYDVLVSGDPRFAEPGFRVGATASAASSGGEPSLDRDADEDGHPAATDCDDVDAAINPDASEVANDGIDQDCSGADLIVTEDQSISFEALPDVPFGTAPVTLTATASSGLAVIYESSGSCSVSESVLTFTEAGSCSVTATQPGTPRFSPASPVTHTLTVTKSPTEVVVQPLMLFREREAVATLRSAVTQEPIVGEILALRTKGGRGGGITICTRRTDETGTVRCEMGARDLFFAFQARRYTAAYAGNGNYEPSSGTASIHGGLPGGEDRTAG